MTNIVYLEDCIEGMKRFSDGYFEEAVSLLNSNSEK